MLLDVDVFSFFLSCLCLLFNFIFLHRRRFFLAACDVPSLEDKFNVDQYSDLVTVTKPVIYISIGEIINTHTVSPDHVMFAASVLNLSCCTLELLCYLEVFVSHD